MKYFLFLMTILVLLTSGCVPAALKYARGMNPGCTVTQQQSSSTSVTVLIRCPGEEPKTETFTRR